jgi:hypothetical protein
MAHVGIPFQCHQFIDPDAPEVTDPAEIIPFEIDQHDMFRAFLFIRAQLAFEPQIGGSILSAGSGAGDRPRIRPASVEADESFR